MCPQGTKASDFFASRQITHWDSRRISVNSLFIRALSLSKFWFISNCSQMRLKELFSIFSISLASSVLTAASCFCSRNCFSSWSAVSFSLQASIGLCNCNWMMKGFRPKPSAVWLIFKPWPQEPFCRFLLTLPSSLCQHNSLRGFVNLSRLIHSPASHADTFPLCEPWREAPQEILSSNQGGNGFYVSRNKRV